tara:strand:- start:525 stop:872 length:348 start_codon:yes stop_codon:yes gene_type:complete
MKITKAKLRQIIKEELGRVLEQDAQGYRAIEGAYGVLSFVERVGDDWEPMDLNYEILMQSTEKLPGFEEIVDVYAYNDLGGSSASYDQLVDQGGFKEGMTIQNLLNLYVEKVLNK